MTALHMANGIRRFRSPPLSLFDTLIRHAKAAHTLSAVEQRRIPSSSSSAVGGDDGDDNASSDSTLKQVNFDSSKWKVFNSRALGLQNSMITAPIWTVLRILQEKGAEAYLVGGCVRDLLLKKAPKDFDIVTSADPAQIIKRFRRCFIVGKRFPVCLVQIQDSIVEVASFGTPEKLGCDKLRCFPHRPPSCSHGDYVRWKDCMRRDFTINGLIYDPFANIVYDYVGGLKDIERAKVRTVIPAHGSFEEDSARILRAFRVAGRLGFEFTRDVACAIQDLSHSILKLSKSRLMMEINYMLAYGAAEASLCLLMRFGVLEVLLPLQASYLSSQSFGTHRDRCNQSNMLLVLFSNLDKLLAPNRPCHSSLWVCLLAFHLALVNETQDTLVVTAFLLALYYGGEMKKAMDAARKVVQTAKRFSPEIVETDRSKSDELLVGQVLKLVSAAKSSLDCMVYNKVPSKDTTDNPQELFYDVAFISKTLHSKVKKVFYAPEGNFEHMCEIREHSDINYKLLGEGVVREVQFAFAKIVLDTLYVDIGDALNRTN